MDPPYSDHILIRFGILRQLRLGSVSVSVFVEIRRGTGSGSGRGVRSPLPSILSSGGSGLRDVC